MKSLGQVLIALLASVAAYLVLFSWVHKPLTVDGIGEMIQIKRAIAEKAPSPRLFILAGSNGRFSHSCQALEPLIDRPCINLSTAAGIGWDYVFAQYRSLFQAGDAIYMPLEYGQYSIPETALRKGPENQLIYQQHRDQWSELGATRVLYAAGSFDLSFLIQGLEEMLLSQAGFRRRFSPETLSPNGDESGHTPEKSKEYTQANRAVVWTAPDLQKLRGASASKLKIEAFIRDMRHRGVQTIGGLPTTFNDLTMPDEVVLAVRDFYEKSGAGFIQLDNRSQYPRDCFYDTSDHLNQEWQLKHSQNLAPLLRQWLEQSTAAAINRAEPALTR